MNRSIYGVLKFLLSIFIGVFYSEIEIRGLENIPDASQPVMFAGTHPNALIDPVLILVNVKRVIRMIAKDQLFRIPILGSFINAIGAVPIKRSSDYEGKRQDNTAIFEKLYQALNEGDSVAIFPEGTTVFEPHLVPIKTGAARIALGFAERHHKSISIVPVGLIYMERNRFRSKVLVLFGKPIVIEPTVPHTNEEVKKITNHLQSALEALTINAPDWATLRVMETVRNLYVPDDASLSNSQYVELMRRFIDGYKAAGLKHSNELDALRREVENYQYKIDALGLSDNDVRGKSKAINTNKTSPLLYLFLWPIAILGMIMNSPIALLCKIGGSLAARGEIVEEATYRLLVALLITPTFYTIVPIMIGRRFGAYAGIFTLIALMLTGLAAASVRPISSSWNFIRSATKIAPKDLRQERAKLKEKVIQAVNTFADPTMKRMFYGKQ